MRSKEHNCICFVNCLIQKQHGSWWSRGSGSIKNQRKHQAWIWSFSLKKTHCSFVVKILSYLFLQIFCGIVLYDLNDCYRNPRNWRELAGMLSKNMGRNHKVYSRSEENQSLEEIDFFKRRWSEVELFETKLEVSEYHLKIRETTRVSIRELGKLSLKNFLN